VPSGGGQAARVLLASSQRCQLNETGADPILRSAAAAFFHEPDITVETTTPHPAHVPAAFLSFPDAPDIIPCYPKKIP